MPTNNKLSTNTKLKTYKMKGSEAKAFHAHGADLDCVGIGSMKVIICKDEDNQTWFAQGLDIDYASNGHSLNEVKKNFESGLRGTIDLHIKAYGHIDKFLKVAPPTVWQELYANAASRHYKYTQVTFHDDLPKTLGYEGINFIMEKELTA